MTKPLPPGTLLRKRGNTSTHHGFLECRADGSPIGQHAWNGPFHQLRDGDRVSIVKRMGSDYPSAVVYVYRLGVNIIVHPWEGCWARVRDEGDEKN